MPYIREGQSDVFSSLPAGTRRGATILSRAAYPRGKSNTWVRSQTTETRSAVSASSASVASFRESVKTSSQSSVSQQSYQNSLAVQPASRSQVVNSSQGATAPGPAFASSNGNAIVIGSTTSAQAVKAQPRKLIHQGRHKLIRQPSDRGLQRSARSRRISTGLQQFQDFVRAQSRKRAAQQLSPSPPAKKAHTWVRTQQATAALPAVAAAAAPNASYVRSTNSRKLQLVRRRTLTPLRALPATPLQRTQTRGSALAKHLLSVRSLKRRTSKRQTLSVRTAATTKPGRLQRIDGVLYKVGGSGLARSLQRQITPKAGRSSPEGAYVRQGKHLVLKTVLLSPKAVAKRLSSARSQPSSRLAATAKASARHRMTSAHVRRPSRLRKSSSSAQTHCLIYCRTGQCREQQAGRCRLVHEPSAVAVCPRWLQGSCSDSACMLQHCRCPDVMPVCTFYLQGLCTTEDCPYAHVKVDPGAPVCQEFVSGHCPRGVACTKKHLTPRMIRQLRQSKALQADTTTSQQTAQVPAASDAAKPVRAADDNDDDLRPAFLR